MRIKNIKVHVVVISFILSLGILFGGLWFYKDVYTNNSLYSSLDNIDSIESYHLVDHNGETSLEIKLKLVDDLQNNFLTIEDSLKSVPNSKNLKVKIIDNPDDTLDAAWQKSQFAVYQALEQGDFTNMAAHLQNTSKEMDIQKCNIQMDEKNIYINLQSSGNYLYKVLERKTDNGGVLK